MQIYGDSTVSLSTLPAARLEESLQACMRHGDALWASRQSALRKAVTLLQRPSMAGPNELHAGTQSGRLAPHVDG